VNLRINVKILTVVLSAAVCFSQSFASDDSSGIKTRLIGMGSIEAGQIVQGESQGSNMALQKVWYQRSYMDLGFDAVIDNRFDFSFVGEALVHYSWTQSKDFLDDNVLQYLFYPHHVEGSYTFGAKESPLLRIGVGVFPFKYNPDVRNLGEYLYRTGTYPPVIANEFDFALARLAGLRLTSTPVDSLNINVLFTTESQVLPLGDFGLSVLGEYTFAKAFTIGAGVFCSHLLSINGSNTTPEKSSNLAPVDSVTKDSIYYSFQGTKVMARLAFDPKVFLPFHGLGKNDLRLYSEASIIGIKNYPVYYNELWRRIPVMVGFNLPAFKMLDVLSLELEWYKWDWPNSYTNGLFNGEVPQPDAIAGYDSKQNELKWSVYAQKHLRKTFSIIGQVAYDHMRLESNAFIRFGTYFGDAMHNHGDWAWALKTQFDY